MAEVKPKLVLAYSGGLDTSVILQWLNEKGFDVIAFCADVGQHHEDFEAVKAKAVSCGALKCIVTDLRADFVSGYGGFSLVAKEGKELNQSAPFFFSPHRPSPL